MWVKYMCKYVDWIHLFYTQESGILQVNVSELGLVTPAGKVVWGEYSFLHSKYYVFCKFLKLLLCLIFYHTTFGDWESAGIYTLDNCAGKYAQVTNNPENDGCINGVLLV